MVRSQKPPPPVIFSEWSLKYLSLEAVRSCGIEVTNWGMTIIFTRLVHAQVSLVWHMVATKLNTKGGIFSFSNLRHFPSKVDMFPTKDDDNALREDVNKIGIKCRFN